MKPCRARLQSDPLSDKKPYRCELDEGHEGPHRCGCGCGMAWDHDGPEGGWQGYDLRDGLLVHRRGEPGWIRELARTKDGTWDLAVHPSARDYVKGTFQYGARDKPDEYVWQCYRPLPNLGLA